MDSSKPEYLKRQRWGRFIPALLVWPIWLFILSTGNHWAQVFQYWPIGIAMVLGSFIAGSTPLGGGVVAFPVSVLVLEFSSSQSRDASVLVQSIGMTAASFLLLTTKRHLLDAEIIAKSVIYGNVGLLIGLEVNAPAAITNLIYTTLVFEFGIIYWYTNTYINGTKAPRNNSQCMIPFGSETKRNRVKEVLLFLQGIIGGFLTSNVGSGSDIMMYGFGIFVWNILYPEKSREDNYFTASSVVVMATMSIATSITRALQPGGIDPEVYYAWGAMGFVVVLGAPVGSLILTPAATPYLRKLFYFLAITQFILFGALKIQNNVAAWITISAITALVLLLLYAHYKKVVAKRIQLMNDSVANSSEKTSANAIELKLQTVDEDAEIIHVDYDTEASTQVGTDSETEQQDPDITRSIPNITLINPT